MDNHPQTRVTLEICVDSLASGVAASRGGADRLELCSALSEGGLTPSYGLIEQVIRSIQLPTMVMIRPHGGSFVYSPPELEVMLSDIDVARQLGATGVVFGVLTAAGTVDKLANQRLLARAAGMEVTFHRAFDRVSDPHRAFAEIAELGFHRLLTSGSRATAAEGVSLIADLVQQKTPVSVMPGSGVRPENASATIRSTRAREIHGSASVASPGGEGPRTTCAEVVRAIRNAIDTA